MSQLQHFLATSSWIDLALFASAALAMPVMSLLSGRQLVKNEGAALVPRYWYTTARGWMAAAIILFAWYFQGRPFAQLGLDFPIGIRGQVGFLVVAVVVAVAVQQLLRIRRISHETLQRSLVTLKRLKIMPRTRGELAVFMLVAITAGVWEELLYRGFLLWFLSPVAGVIGAVLISSAIFGIGHVYQGWRGVLMTGTVGLIFAVLYALTLSLWWLMAAHALMDIYGGLAAFLLRQRADSPSNQTLG